MGDSYPYWRIGLIVVLIIFEAIVTATLASIQSASESTIRKKLEENENDKRLAQALALLEEPTKYIGLLEALTTGTSIVVGILFTNGIIRDVMDCIWKSSGTYYNLWIYKLLVLLVVFCFALIVVFLGNILSRRLATIHPDLTVCIMSGIASKLMLIFGPLVYLTTYLTKVVLWILRIKVDENEENVTEDEIISIVNEGFEQGILEDSEATMISNIMEFDEKEVMDIMTHRKKMVAIEASTTIEEAMRFVLEQSFSRFPVYEEEIDNIIGILHVKDLMKYYVSGKSTKEHVKMICSKPFLVPDTQPIDVLWKQMRERKLHMAIAIDEYGQTAGLVAMEDILEEIVGNISDEYDVEEKMIIKQGEGRYLVKGLTPLEDMEEILDIEFEQEDYDTLNGFLISMLGHIPKEEEQAVLHYGSYRFHIVDVKDNIIRYIRVVKEFDKEQEVEE